MSDRGTRIGIGIILLIAAPYARVASTFFYSLGANMLLAEASAILQGNSKKTLRDRGIKAALQGEDEPLKLVFGEARVGGNVLVLGTSGTKSEYFHYALCHSLTHAGGIESITDVYINEDKVDDTDINGSGDITSGTYQDWLNLRRYVGTDSQTVDTTLQNALAYWDSTALGKGVAYTAFRCLHDGTEEAGGVWKNRIPQFSALVRGIKCYDPRLDTTNGGSGDHRLNDVDTWEWTNNPALIIGTYLVMAKTDGGVGLDSDLVNWTQIAASANVCEENITVPDNAGGSTTQDKYQFNGVISTGDSYISNIRKMLDAMAGAITYSEGQYNVFAGDYTTPTVTIDDDWMVGQPLYSSKGSINDLFNSVKSTYIDPLANYNTLESVPFEDASFVTDDGRKRWKKLDLEAGVQDRYQSQYLNKIWGYRSRHKRTMQAKLNTKGLALKVWDIVTVDITIPTTINDTFRVVDLSWDDENSAVDVKLVEENSDTYDSVLGDFTEDIPTTKPNTQVITPPAPSSPNATSVEDGIEVTWTPPGLSEYSVIEIHRSTTSGSGFSKVATVRGSSYVDALVQGETRYYKMRSVSPINSDNYSSFTSEVSATAKSLTYAGTGDQVADNRNLPAVNYANGASSISATITATDAGSDATITVDSGWSIRYGSGTLSGGPSGSMTGLSFSTDYFIYYDLASATSLSGGTFGATQTAETALSGDNRVYIGTVTTPADGGGSSGGSTCVSVDTLLADHCIAGQVEAGKTMLVRDPMTGVSSGAEVISARTLSRDCIRVEWSDDYLECTPSAPLWDGTDYVLAGNARHIAIVRNGVEVIEAVTVKSIGKRDIRHIFVNDQCFLASAGGRSFAMHHNAKDPLS